jgi:hypothetical protein
MMAQQIGPTAAKRMTVMSMRMPAWVKLLATELLAADTTPMARRPMREQPMSKMYSVCRPKW